MKLGVIFCLFNRHRPIRRKVESSGRHLSGNCRYCGTRIERIGPRMWKRAP